MLFCNDRVVIKLQLEHFWLHMCKYSYKITQNTDIIFYNVNVW